MMARFHKIFWGLLLVNVVVPLDGHAPWQGLGYILLALGARRLAPVSPRFGRAAALSWAALSWMLVSVWLFDLLGTCDPITGEDKILYPAVHTLLDCLLVWALFGGIKEYALRHASPEPAAEISTRRAAGQSPLWHLPTPQAIALSASRCRAAYVVLVVLASGAAIFQPGTLAVVIATIFLAIWVWMAFDLIHRVRHELVAWDESLREGADPPWQFSLRTLLLAPVALWLLLLACFPKLMTGDFCIVKVRDLSYQEDGQVSFSYSTRTSSGTDIGDGLAVRFPLAWPRRGNCEPRVRMDFYLNPDRAPLAAEEIRDRLLIDEGRIYRVVPGKPLCLYDFKGKDGMRYCHYVKVTPGSRLGW